MVRAVHVLLLCAGCDQPGAAGAPAVDAALPPASTPLVSATASSRLRQDEDVLSVTELHHAHDARPDLWRGKSVRVRGHLHSLAQLGDGATLALVAAPGEPTPSISCALERRPDDLQPGDLLIVDGVVESASGVLLTRCRYHKDHASEKQP